MPIVLIFTTKFKPVIVNLPVFLANRLNGKDKENLSGPVIRIAVVTIALGLAVMIIAVAVLIGFQTEIRNKVIGFSAHIRIDNFDANSSYEASPVSINQPFYPELEETEGIRHIQVFALKAGIIKTEDQMHGVVFKGIGKDFDWDFFDRNLIAGAPFQLADSSASNQLLISEMTSRKLNLITGDEVRMYFIS
ncbi:MAG: ABC transporter permease, partial [Bacteroidales bacterium]|nr:ABC transporter permease [Bacteroidales bacterium]